VECALHRARRRMGPCPIGNAGNGSRRWDTSLETQAEPRPRVWIRRTTLRRTTPPGGQGGLILVKRDASAHVIAVSNLVRIMSEAPRVRRDDRDGLCASSSSLRRLDLRTACRVDFRATSRVTADTRTSGDRTRRPRRDRRRTSRAARRPFCRSRRAWTPRTPEASGSSRTIGSNSE